MSAYRFVSAYSSVSDFNCHKKDLTAKPLRQGYRYHKNGKYNVSLRKPEFYGDLVYRCFTL